MKIRRKFIMGISFILLVSVFIMNFAITSLLNSNMEGAINNSLKQVMDSTHEYIKYKLLTSSSKDKKHALVEECNYIVKHISLNYQCTCNIMNVDNRLINGNIQEEFKDIVSISGTKTMKSKAIVDLKYENNGVNAVLTYPMYIYNNYVGIISIVKNFDYEYITYKNTMKIVKGIEGGIFIIIFIFLLLMITKITKPITMLTSAVKKLANGDYDTFIDEHGKDEIAILAREFIYMRNKIKKQIETIRGEKDKVYKLEKGRRAFFNSVTHELKTPLTAISGYAELLLTNMVQDSEFQKRAIERIYSESDRLHNLVLNLIDVSKGISVIEEEFKEVNMKKLITESCNDMSIKASKYNLKIVNNIESGVLKVQEDKIREVMINLIDNAIKYSCDKNEVLVNSHIEDNKYCIEVINYSKPIPENIFKNVFEPFVKFNHGENKESRGLGLYLCKEIIKKHGGKIVMENGEIIRMKIFLKCRSIKEI